MKTLHVLVVGLAVMALAAGDGVEAREWSDEIRMTYAGEHYFSGRHLQAEVDSHDDIHVLYAYFGYDVEGYGRRQPVYQKFNRFGEPLTDPILITEIAECTDTSCHGYDLFIDNNEDIYVLWGWRKLHITKLNRNGEPLIRDIYLDEITVFTTDHYPRLAVDSEGNIIIIAVVYNPELQEPERTDDLAYGRFTEVGELIDTLVFQQSVGVACYMYVAVSGEDTLHFIWQNSNLGAVVYYSKVDPDGEFLIENYQLPDLINEERTQLSSFCLDNNGKLLFLVHDRADCYVRRFDYDLESEFGTYIAESNNRWGDIFVDRSNNIHLIDSFSDDDYNDISFLGYAMLNDEGEIIDSLQVVHDSRMNGDYRRRAVFYNMEVVAFPDSNVSILWVDSRYRTQEEGEELVMRYNANDNDVESIKTLTPVNTSLIKHNYPNPFNSITVFPLNISIPGDYFLRIAALNGVVVYEKELFYYNTGSYSISWNGQDTKGFTVPGGFYLVNLEGSGRSQSIVISFAK